MQKVSTILAAIVVDIVIVVEFIFCSVVVAVDSVVVAEFVISASPLTWYIGSQVLYFGGWKKILYFMTLS